jgi:HEAT repeat protein
LSNAKLASNNEGNVSKKLWDNSVFNGMMVPLAIVLVGAALIFGVTRLLSVEQSYKELVHEINSKTFGNRWVAAYELSKIIANNKIPAEEVPWVIENLSEQYHQISDPRTKDFIVVSLSAFKRKEVIPFLLKAIKSDDPNIALHALLGLGNMPAGVFTKWSVVEDILFNSKDNGMLQSAIFILATHKVPTAKNKLQTFLKSDNDLLKYSAAIALINFKEPAALPLLKSILALEKFDAPHRLEGLKMNILTGLEREGWGVLNSEIKFLADNEKNLKVKAKARGLLTSTN